MKPKHIYTLFILWAILACLISREGYAQSIDEIQISGNFQDVPLSSFFDALEEQYGVQVYYKRAWVDKYSVNISFNNNPLSRALNSIFVSHELTYEVFQDNSIVVFPRRLDTRSNLEGVNQTLVIGNPINKGRYKKALITGKVIDGKTGEPLPGAVIYNSKLDKGATTGSGGSFKFELPTGEHYLSISFMGFQGYEKQINLIEPGEVEFELFEESHSIGEILVVADEFNTSRTQMSMVQMSAKDIKNLPLLMGERDVMKSIVMLPGIQSVGELSSGFNVRGGNSDQNLILLENSPIFNTSHLFGFISAINPDVVEDMRVFKGGLPARFGERVSSIMEIEMKDGNEDKIKFYGGLGVINSRLALEGPLTKNKKLTFIAAGRMSYTNWVLKQVPDADISNSVTDFYDVSGKISYKFDKNNWLNIFGYASNDEFSTSAQSINDYGNALLNFESHNKYGEELNAEFNLSFSRYKFRLTDFANGKEFEAYYLDNQIQYGSAKYNLIWHPHPQHNIQAGFNAINYLNDPGKITPVAENTIINSDELDRENAFEGALFLSDEFDIFPGLTVNIGMRYSLFALLGEKTVFLYDENQAKSASTVVDSLVFDKNEIVKRYGGIEPRLALNWETDGGYSYKVSYQRTKQYISQISNNAVMSPAEMWKTSDYDLEPLVNDQIAIGVQKENIFNEYSFSSELYYKQLHNLIEYKNGAQIIMNKHLETDLIPSDGYSYGVELSLRKPYGRLTGWMNYTFSRTMRKTNGEFDDEQINKGKYYPSIYDKPHDLSIVANYNISRRWRVSGNFVFISGRPVTLPEVTYQYAGETLIYYSDRNKYRMPPYHRFDISVTFDENLRRRRMWKGSWTLSVYNLYGRKNPYSVYYRKTIADGGTDYKSYSLFKLAVIGIPVPSITYNFTF
ncbi:carboxypeptidase-like regulatory domain-containing protein [Maribellus maritimus]|uniref:carboxypeptidase-like regulatory domain-containing protein n=1 Tax=Maribellus maritimus TaxID=2870838 RepID=UPI001EE9C564|nr:carboxypeptidase-like regulatory domain-containing protein [Maribellus maritimus]MCG6186051.1 carboxypeptidase-like regulatory domain-containing protein [Maribellus maritimus]